MIAPLVSVLISTTLIVGGVIAFGYGAAMASRTYAPEQATWRRAGEAVALMVAGAVVIIVGVWTL